MVFDRQRNIDAAEKRFEDLVNGVETAESDEDSVEESK